MTVNDILDIFIEEETYMEHSMLNKSYDDLGCTYKWVSKLPGNKRGNRREIFIATSTTEEDIKDRTVISYIELDHAY